MTDDAIYIVVVVVWIAAVATDNYTGGVKVAVNITVVLALSFLCIRQNICVVEAWSMFLLL